jgi:uncharacterized coiled-coil protein SlyX
MVVSGDRRTVLEPCNERARLGHRRHGVRLAAARLDRDPAPGHGIETASVISLVSIDGTSAGVGGGAVAVIVGVIAVLKGGVEGFQDFLKEWRGKRDDDVEHKTSYISVTSDSFMSLNQRLEEENQRYLARIADLEARLDRTTTKLDEATLTIGRQQLTIAQQEVTITALTGRVERLEGGV